jgi:hypothetical protein
MTPCPICGATTPAPERILPLAIQGSTTKAPLLALFLCHGAVRVDPYLLRFGIIARMPYSCRNTRWYPWDEMSHEFRHRAAIAEQLRLTLGGWI